MTCTLDPKASKTGPTSCTVKTVLCVRLWNLSDVFKERSKRSGDILNRVDMNFSSWSKDVDVK